MSAETIALAFSIGGVAVTSFFAVLFLIDRDLGMRRVHHLTDHLPKVMAGRYVGFCLLAIGAAIYADFAVTAFLFAVYAFVSLVDAAIYHRAGKPFQAHLVAAVGAGAVAAASLAAWAQGARA